VNTMIPDMDKIFDGGKKVSSEPIIHENEEVGSAEVWLFEGVNYLINRYKKTIDHDRQEGDSFVEDFWTDAVKVKGHPATLEKLEQFYKGEIHNYVRGATKNSIVIHGGSDWEGFKDSTITIDDVIQYYSHDARNLLSGCRSLGSITGDWRPIDALAHECLEWFKVVNVEVLRRKSEKAGMTPKF